MVHLNPHVIIAIIIQNNIAHNCCVLGVGNLLLGLVNNIKAYHDNNPCIQIKPKATNRFLLKIRDVSIY